MKMHSCFHLQVICILCRNALSIPLFEFKTLQEIPQVVHKIQILNQKFNFDKGHGSIARLCKIGFRGEIQSTTYHQNLELTARWTYDPHADKVGIIMGILINRFNFTLERELWCKYSI